MDAWQDIDWFYLGIGVGFVLTILGGIGAMLLYEWFKKPTPPNADVDPNDPDKWHKDSWR